MSRQEESGGSRTERKKEETKKKIIAVAMNLFKQNGFDATTMEQIAEEADIAKGTLYNYFPVKEAILSAYIQRAFKEKNPARITQLQKMPDTRSRLILILSQLIEGVQAQREIFEKFLVYRVQNIISLHKVESEKSGIELLATEIIVLGQKSAEIRNDIPVEILLDLFEFIFVEVAKQLFLEPEKFKAREVIERCVDLFMNGVKPKIKKKS